MSKGWIIDADNIASIDDFQRHMLVDTTKIHNFMSKDSLIRVVFATKGFGKTFLLTAKRASLKNHNYKLLPENNLRDIFVSGSSSLSHRLISFLKDSNTWTTLWKASLAISIIKGSHESYHEICKSGLWEDFSESKRPSEILDIIFTKLLSDRNYFLNLRDFVSIEIIPLYKDIRNQVALFIDRVDERFQKHLGTFKNKKDYRSVWFNSQIALLEAIYELHRVNRHIKIFAGLRSEILIELPEVSSLTLQLKDHFIELNYEDSHLKKMFMNSISATPDTYLAIADKKETNPILSFLGKETIYNNYTKSEEDAFCYISRHTLRRPRDLMYIGSEICDLEDERSVTLTEKLDEWTVTMVKAYIKKELTPFYDIDCVALFKILDCNVFNFKQVLEITDKYHNTTRKNGNPFLTLYKCGLLGINKSKLFSDDNPRQYFLYPGEHIKEDHDDLPFSESYYVHPILNQYIKSINSEYIPLTMPVGYGYESQESYRNEKHILSRESIRDTNHAKSHATGMTRCEILDAVDLLSGDETILDYGCGEAALLACLTSIDGNITKGINYIGIDKITKVAQEISITKSYGDKLASEPRFYNYPHQFDDIKFSKVNYFFLIDTFHEMKASEICHVLSSFIAEMNNNAKVIIIESDKSIKPTALDKDFFANCFKPYEKWIKCSLKTSRKEVTPSYIKAIITRIGRKRKMPTNFISSIKNAYGDLYSRIMQRRDAYKIVDDEYIHYDNILTRINEIINM